jgi:hypothetical protein
MLNGERRISSFKASNTLMSCVETAPAPLYLLQLPNLYEPDKLVPFRVRQPHGVLVLADGDAMLGDLDLGTNRALWAKGDCDPFHSGNPS